MIFILNFLLILILILKIGFWHELCNIAITVPKLLYITAKNNACNNCAKTSLHNCKKSPLQ